MAKLTTEEFINKARIVHGDKYDYSKTNYINKKTKIIITCPIHGDFEQIADYHRAGNRCQKCGKSIKLTTKIFIEKANKIHNNRYDYSKVEYKNSNTKIIIICSEHGEFLQTPDSHLYGRQGCPKCGNIQKGLSKRKPLNEFIQKARIIHGNKYDYSNVKYVNNHIKINIICPEHGEFKQAPHNHTEQKQGCPKCRGYYKTTKEFILKAKEIHGDKYDYSKVEYIGSHNKVIIICPKHGEFLQAPK